MGKLPYKVSGSLAYTPWFVIGKGCYYTKFQGVNFKVETLQPYNTYRYAERFEIFAGRIGNNL